jgi:hypothetical protein
MTAVDHPNISAPFIDTVPRFTISLKRSTQKSPAINKPPADYPILPQAEIKRSDHVRDALWSAPIECM